MKNKKVALVILVWNDYENTKNCIESLQKISYDNLEIIVVDNNSSDNSCKRLEQEFNGLIFIYNKENYGYAGGNNRGIEYAINNGADYVFVMNNDITIDSPNIIDSMLECYSKNERLGVLGPKLFQLSTSGDFYEITYKSKYYDLLKKVFLRKDFKGMNLKHKTDCEIRTVVSGCAFMIKREVLQKTGGFNEDFFMFVEENDLCLRAIKSGYIVGQSKNNNTIVRHLGGVSYSKTAAWKYFLLNRNKFLEFRSFKLLSQIGLFIIHLVGLFGRLFKFLIKGEFNYIFSSLLGTIYGVRIWIKDIFKLSVKGEYLEQARTVASGEHIIRKIF